MIVDSGEGVDLYLASRNLPHVAVCDYTQVDPVSLLSFEKILFTAEALQLLEGDLA
ncbi:MAG: 50S ribosomal protein L4 [Gammaproteobacteria bacterium]|nr:50S ribosomal protein L4 [Gammaproteobacteria bacterium]